MTVRHNSLNILYSDFLQNKEKTVTMLIEKLTKLEVRRQNT